MPVIPGPGARRIPNDAEYQEPPRQPPRAPYVGPRGPGFAGQQNGQCVPPPPAPVRHVVRNAVIFSAVGIGMGLLGSYIFRQMRRNDDPSGDMVASNAIPGLPQIESNPADSITLAMNPDREAKRYVLMSQILSRESTVAVSDLTKMDDSELAAMVASGGR